MDVIPANNVSLRYDSVAAMRMSAKASETARTGNRQLRAYGTAVITVAAAMAAREIFGALIAPHDFLWIIPLAGVYIASVFGGTGPGLLSIGLFLISINGVRAFQLLPDQFPAISLKERGFLQGLFVLLALAIWYLARTRRNAIESLSRTAADRDRTVVQLEELLSMVSHDMRSPLNSLKLSLYALERISEDADARFKRPLAAAHRQIGRILDLIERLLEPMKNEDFGDNLQLENFDLAILTQEVVEGMTAEIEAAGCPLKTDLSPVTGFWDRFRLERAVTNLLSNAVKYGRGTAITIRLAAEPGAAGLSIHDEGPGIAAEDHEAIFKRFERATSSGVKREGLGLGLYIARRIVEMHGGTIVIDSELGKGATFVVTLPITTAAAQGATLMPQQNPARELRSA
jgi:signal transduction histidine kinase